MIIYQGKPPCLLFKINWFCIYALKAQFKIQEQRKGCTSHHNLTIHIRKRRTGKMRPGKSENTNMQIKGQNRYWNNFFYHSIKQQLCNFYFILVHQLQQGIIYIFLSCITVSDKACIFAYCHIGCNVQKVDIHGPHFPLIIFPLKEVKKGFANHLYFGKNIFNSTHYFKFMSESQSFVSPKKFAACILKRRYHVRINWRVLG